MCSIALLLYYGTVFTIVDTQTNLDSLLLHVLQKYHRKSCLTLLTNTEFPSSPVPPWLTALQGDSSVLWFQSDSSNMTANNSLRADLQKTSSLGCNTYVILYPSVRDITSLTQWLAANIKLRRGKIIFHAPKGSLAEIDELFEGKLLKTNADSIFLRPMYNHYEIRTHRVPQDVASYVIDRFSFSGKFQFDANLFPVKFSNLQGHRLKVTTFDYRPMIQRFTTLEGYSYSGLEYSLLLAHAQAMNFTFTIYEPPDNQLWGQQMPDGSFTGLMGELVYLHADIGFAGLYIQPARMAVMDYTSAYRILYECFLAPLPGPSPRWMALILPFDTWVWISTLLLLIVSILALYVIAQFSRGDNYLKRFSTVIYFIYSGLMQLQVSWSMRTNAVRHFLVGWFIIATIVPTVYKSMLTAYLSVPIKPVPMDTIEQLLGSNLAKGGFGNNTIETLKGSTDPIWQKLATQMISYTDFAWAYDQLGKGKLVITSSDDNLKYLIKTRFTNPRLGETVHIIKQCLLPFSTGFGLQKDSPYRARLNEITQRVIEGGLVNYWFEEALRDSRAENPDSDHQQASTSTQSTTLTLESLQGAYFLIMLGYIFSAFVFGLELAIYHIQKRLKK